MTKYTILTLGVLGIATALGGTLVAQAQSAGGSSVTNTAEADLTRVHARAEQDGRRGERRRGGGQGRAMIRALFEAADTNDDDALTTEEIAAYRTARLSEVDVSGDGALSIEEFDNLYRDLTRARMVDAFQRLDADGDGQISPQEMDDRVARFVERMDRDGDGVLTLGRRGQGSGRE